MDRERSKYINTIEISIPKKEMKAEPVKTTNEIDTIKGLIDEIVERHPDVISYAYIKELHSFMFPREQNGEFLKVMKSILYQDVRWDFNHRALGFVDEQTRCRDFTIYYCLALYCKRKEKVNVDDLSLEKLIEDYDALFSEFVLHLEIRSWYARREERFDEAYRYDRMLIDKIGIDVNAGVYTSFASSISSRLEKEYKSQKKGKSIFFWENPIDRTNDWKEACSIMPSIIKYWKEVWNSTSGYAKHYFIWGKLLLYSPELKDMSQENRRDCIKEAKRLFSMARSCENPSDSDYSTRCSDYDRYRDRCDEIEEAWSRYRSNTLTADASAMSIRNDRKGLNKPNEDYYIVDQKRGIYLLADGVTRPHDEYLPGLGSRSAVCAQTLCETVHRELLCSDESDPSKAMIDAMLKGNREIRKLYEGQQFEYPPCTTFLCAVIRNDQLYYSSCCDTIAFLIRNNIKIQLTEHYNKHAELLQLSKADVYSTLHNNIKEPAGFGIFNGDEELSGFLHVGQIQVKQSDRIVLATDGMSRYLHMTRASHLHNISPEQMWEESKQYDCMPFQKYADDKTFIVIDM